MVRTRVHSAHTSLCSNTREHTLYSMSASSHHNNIDPNFHNEISNEFNRPKPPSAMKLFQYLIPPFLKWVRT